MQVLQITFVSYDWIFYYVNRVVYNHEDVIPDAQWIWIDIYYLSNKDQPIHDTRHQMVHATVDFNE